MNNFESLRITGIPKKAPQVEKELEQEPTTVLEGWHDNVVTRIKEHDVTPASDVKPRDPEEMLRALRERRNWR
jgi:hypothetical protein